MEQLFKVKAVFKDEEEKSLTRVFLLEAVNYTDAETSATKYLNPFGECNFDIAKVSYDDIKHIENKQDNIEYFWYEVKTTIEIENEKGEIRYKTEKVLFEGESLEDVVDIASKYWENESREWYLSSINETLIEDVVYIE